MTQEIATELLKYYLATHGAKYESGNIFWYERRQFEAIVWLTFVNIWGPRGWIGIDLDYFNVDATDPKFNPEIFFKPILNGLKRFGTIRGI